MTDSQAKELAHELTMKYLDNNKAILSDPAISSIPKMVERIAEINKTFYEAIIHNDVLNSLY